MSRNEDPIFHIVDYILNSASEDELIAISEAVQRRANRGPLGGLNFQEMAQKITSQFDMAMPDMHGMARGMVRNLILQHQPGISPREVEILLDHYVPGEKRQAEQREQMVPPEILQNMIRQFVAYSVGRMPSDEERELRAAMPNWPESYWEVFSEETRTLIRDLIQQAR
ncbi:MAG: hypothetical protein RIF32_22750 [Leptospirales bacterium]|jgi:hypothetical protein